MQSVPGPCDKEKALPIVLDMARPRYKENTTWLGMRGRDAVWKVDSKGEQLTIDFSEIQFIVNHNSQSNGQNKSAKSGMNLRKKTIHTKSLQRKGEDTMDNGILLWTKAGKNGPMKLRSDYRSEELVYNTQQIRKKRTNETPIRLQRSTYKYAPSPPWIWRRATWTNSPFINTKGSIRRLLHPVPHGGSGMNTGELIN